MRSHSSAPASSNSLAQRPARPRAGGQVLCHRLVSKLVLAEPFVQKKRREFHESSPIGKERVLPEELLRSTTNLVLFLGARAARKGRVFPVHLAFNAKLLAPHL